MKKKSISIVMTKQLAEKIRMRENAEAPNEMCFVVGGHLSKSETHLRFLATEVFFPNPDDYEIQHPTACRPTQKWLHKIYLHCAENQLQTIDGHTHPFAGGLPRESGMDIEAAKSMYPAMAESFPGMAILSMVISANFEGVEAHIYRPALNFRIAIEKVLIFEPGQMRILYPTSSPLRTKDVPLDEKYLSRLSLAFGQEAILNNSNIRIGAIGGGSLGEPVIAQLANLGFKITIGDMDEFCIENANRSLFGNQVTAKRGITKAELCRRAVLQTNPDADVRVVNGDIREEEIQKQFLDCDLLVITTDNETSRFVANHMAVTHGMALFDAATGVMVEEGTLTGVQGQIIKVIPGNNLCHECSDFFDSNVAHQGLLSEEDFELARSRGYVAGDDMPAPSVMPLNMTMAGIAVWEILRYVTGATPDETWDILSVNLLNPGMQPHYYQRTADGWRSNCILCNPEGMLLGGETVPLLTRQKGYTHSKTIKLIEANSGRTYSQKSEPTI